jgi:hypothetical protein
MFASPLSGPVFTRLLYALLSYRLPGSKLLELLELYVVLPPPLLALAWRERASFLLESDDVLRSRAGGLVINLCRLLLRLSDFSG